MQDHSSGSLLKSLLIGEIEETGSRIARLIQPGAPVDRCRRREIRALLREAFQSTQEDRTIDDLTKVLDQLHEVLVEIVGSPTQALEQRLERKDRIGVVKTRLFDRSSGFSDNIQQNSDTMADAIQARLNRTLAVSAKANPGDEEGNSLEPRPLKAAQEMMELVTKKHW